MESERCFHQLDHSTAILRLQITTLRSGESRPSDKWGMWGGGGGGGGLQRNFFRPFGPQFGLKIREEAGPPSPSPRSASAAYVMTSL